MKRSIVLLIALFSLFALAACGGTPTQTSSTGTASQSGSSGKLTESYKDALPIASQLILGSLRLEETAQAIDASDAGKLLPLWQAYQTLSSSDATAAAELTAVLKQIQNTMRLEQIQSIAAMQLTSQDITTTMQALGIGQTGMRGTGAGRTGGQMPGGGMPGGGGLEQMSPQAQATAIAQRQAQGGDLSATSTTRALLGPLITSLRVKTGEVTQAQLQAEQTQRTVLAWLPVVADATGIPADALQQALTGGATLAEALKAKGGDMKAAETALRDALKTNVNLDDQAITNQIATILNSKTASQ